MPNSTVARKSTADQEAWLLSSLEHLAEAVTKLRQLNRTGLHSLPTDLAVLGLIHGTATEIAGL